MTNPTTIKTSALRQAVGLVVWVLICFGAAGLGSLATYPSVAGWYTQLVKPTWTPPGWVFGPVWTVLYVAMAFAAWLVWRQGGLAAAKLPLSAFAIQLALNSAWSVLFFGYRQPGLAAIEIVLLWLAILASLVLFWFRSKWAGLIMIPYLAWVTFAAVLNWEIWRING